MTTLTETAPQPLKKPFPIGRWMLILVLLTIFGYATSRIIQDKPLFGAAPLHGFELTEPARVPNFTLTTQHGDPFALYDMRDRVVLLYFGYTYCPDVCPITLAVLKNARSQLPTSLQDDVQIIMITVDPERDTPELLTKYLAHFDQSFLGLTGTEDEIAAAGAPIGIFSERVTIEGVDGYFIDHTATVAVIDKQGQLRTVYPFNMEQEYIAADLNILARE